jgi:hypothetical protein
MIEIRRHPQIHLSMIAKLSIALERGLSHNSSRHLHKRLPYDAQMSAPVGWLESVAAVQSAKMTPEVIVQIRERAQAQQRTASLITRSRTLERTASLSHASFAWSPSLSAPRSISAVSQSSIQKTAC